MPGRLGCFPLCTPSPQVAREVLRQEPSHGLDPLTPETLSACREALQPLWPRRGGSEGPVLLSYSTSVSQTWLLALSAAKHGLPVVLAGLGMPRWPWWQGGRKKLPGSRRALQLIQALEPQATVISSDTGDLLIGNSLSAAHKRALRELASNNELLVAAECNSWPLCYREAYAHDAEVRECLGSHGACYPNSGVLTASVATMLRFYERWADTINASAHMRRAERFNDQAAIHRLYQNRSAHQARGDFTLRVDKENLFSLQLWKCDGERMRKKGPFEYCHEKRFEPAKGVRTEDSGRTTLFTDELGVDQRPFLVHSNGYHYVMKRDATGLRPLLDRYTAEPPPSELLSTGVVLVDTFDHGLCNFTTLGWLMNRTRSQGEPALSLRTAEHVPERT